MRTKVLTGVVVFLLIFSMSASPSAQNPNFELSLIIPSDVVHLDSLAQAIRQDLASLLIDIKIEGSPRPVYQNDLSSHDYDLALYSMDAVNEPFPPLWSTYFENGSRAQRVFRANDTGLLEEAEIDAPENLFTLLDQYRTTDNVSNHIQLAKLVQTEYTSNWLLDLPLLSTANVYASWSSFEGFDGDEGVINSLFMGADWESNPEERQDRDRTMQELHVALGNFDGIRNPLFYTGSSSFEALQVQYSSAFITDKNYNIYPNLAVAFNKTVNHDGSATWRLHLRNDATWTDGEPLTSKDLKFTYDMASFDWIGATTRADWGNLQQVSIIDNETLEVTFSDNSLQNKHSLASQYIIPEHILNVSVNVNGQERHPYNGYDPSGSELWNDYNQDPVSAGPFLYNSDESTVGSVDVFEKNPNYWSPSSSDSPDGVFNLSSGTTLEAKYFDGFNELDLNTLVYRISGSQNIDPNTLITSFLAGTRDIVEFDTLEPENDLSDRGDINVQASGVSGGGITLLANPDNIHLQKFGVRQAIGQAIDRLELVQITGLGHFVQGTPVSQYYPEYYHEPAAIKYDFPSARDTFRGLGYEALDDNEFQDDFRWPWQELPITPTPVILAFIALALGYRRSRD